MKKRLWEISFVLCLILFSVVGLRQVRAAGVIFAADFNDGTLNGWTPNGGVWTNPGSYARVVCGADAWNIAAAAGSDFTYHGDCKIESGNAVGLSFRTNANGTQGYDVVIDRVDGRMKLCKRPYMVLGSYSFKVNTNQVYHIAITAQGAHLSVSLDGAERISLNDVTYSAGRFGMFGYAATAQIDNLTVMAEGDQVAAETEPVSSHAGIDSVIFRADFNDGTLAGWAPNGGAWANPGSCARVVCGADAWNIAAATGSDFTFNGDCKLESGNAVGLSFRTNANGTQGYDVVIDRVDGRMKLCKRPYMVLGSYSFKVNTNQVYHIAITAQGAHLSVSLDGAERISLNDATYSAGRFGMFGYAATAHFDNLVVNPL